MNTEPVWTSDSRRVVYSSNRGAGAGVNLYWQAADGSGSSELLSRLPFEQWPTDVSRDGRLLAFYGQPKGQGYGIWTVTLDGAAKTEQVLSSTGVLRGARFSPDGRWLAYASSGTRSTLGLESAKEARHFSVALCASRVAICGRTVAVQDPQDLGGG